MNLMRLLCIILLMLGLLVFVAVAAAQDGNEDSNEDGGIEVTLPEGAPSFDDISPELPNDSLEYAAAWLPIFIALAAAFSGVVAMLVEAYPKRLLRMIEAVTPFMQRNPEVRHVLTVIAALLMALFGAVVLEINLIQRVPFGYFDEATQQQLWAMNTVLLTAGSFLSHEWWNRIRQWGHIPKLLLENLDTITPIMDGTGGGHTPAQ